MYIVDVVFDGICLNVEHCEVAAGCVVSRLACHGSEILIELVGLFFNRISDQPGN